MNHGVKEKSSNEKLILNLRMTETFCSVTKEVNTINFLLFSKISLIVITTLSAYITLRKYNKIKKEEPDSVLRVGELIPEILTTLLGFLITILWLNY